MLDEYEVLNYVYKNANMGKESTKTLLKSLEGKDNKIINAVIDILNSYEKFEKDAERILKLMNEKGKKYGQFATLSADMGVMMEVFKDNSDSAIADMLITGLTKGEIEMTKMFSSFDENIDSEIKELIKDFKDFQTNAISKLKPYL